MEKLSCDELVKLIQAVFPAQPGVKQLGILVDVPRVSDEDTPNWKQRRIIAEGWFQELKGRSADLNLDRIALVAYPDVGSNNADLPAEAFLISDQLPELADGLEGQGEAVPFDTIFTDFQLFLSPTQYSTTAPLKNAAKKYLFRAATMPGFAPSMIPALRIDYNEVFRRVAIIKDKTDPAQWADVLFKLDGEKEYRMHFDLRHRKGHLSSGRFPDKGTAGNLPSGETYIVPYEGEKGEASETNGLLPVQLGEEIVCFTIQQNRAVSVENVDGDGTAAAAEKDHLEREPAYGNMAELGFGVLADFGLSPIDEILLDEKLGFHIAFGRSDHFGGIVSPADFSCAKEVIHLDRIYIPATQPRISVASIVFGYQDGSRETIIENDQYLVF